MGLWTAARGAVDMAGATISALQLFDGLSRSDHPREALAVVRAVVVTLIEGYQGRLPGKSIQEAIFSLESDLRLAHGIPSQTMIEKFKAVL